MSGCYHKPWTRGPSIVAQLLGVVREGGADGGGGMRFVGDVCKNGYGPFCGTKTGRCPLLYSKQELGGGGVKGFDVIMHVS